MSTEAVTASGRVIRRLYFNSEDGFCILQLAVRKEDQRTLGHSKRGVVVVKGKMRSAEEGMTVKVTGHWVEHPRYGAQINADLMSPVLADLEAVYRYLSGGSIAGVGKTLARRIVDHFGAEAIEVVRERPERLQEVAGIGPEKARQIGAALAEERAIEAIMRFLYAAGLDSRRALRIHRELGDSALDQIRANPYCLAQVRGVGFETADQVARSLGVEHDSGYRIEAGINHLIEEMMRRDGDTLVERGALIGRAQRSLGVERQSIERVVGAMVDSRQLAVARIEGSPGIALARVHDLERAAARRIAELLDASGDARDGVPCAQALSRYSDQPLAPAQMAALQGVFRHRFCVITGGPGTGKSTLTRAILNALSDHARTELAVELAAPTGRAARRLEEATGRESATLHRLLRIDPETGRSALDAPLDADVVLVDEFSMVDTMVFSRLMEAVTPQMRVIFVGDVDQLPSVGPGQVLADLIDSAAVPVYRLDHVFRNAGAIKLGAAAVRSGALPEYASTSAGNFHFTARPSPQASDVVAIVRRMIEHDGIAPEAIQVLAPMRKEAVGVHALNKALQKALVGDPSAHPQHLRSHDTLFQRGDRVMQTANRTLANCQGEAVRINNGDIGYISHINAEEGTLKVNFDGKVVPLARNDLIDLELAFAITVHKAQGAEYEGVVMPLSMAHVFMLRRGRRILYTGMTRAKSQLHWVGDPEAVEIAVRSGQERNRRTGLSHFMSRLGEIGAVVAER
jgi:exodeoxyribonuclease V alpha subunit